IRRDRDTEINRETQRYASALGKVLESQLARLDASLRRSAQLWTVDRFANDLAAWHDSAEVLLAEHPALLAVLCSAPSGAIAGSVEGKRLLLEVLPEARRQGEIANREFIIGPLRAANGRQVFGVQVRASSSGSDERTSFALLDADRLVADALADRAPDFALAVSVDGQEVYRRDPASGRVVPSLRISEPIALPNGKPWRLDVAPSVDTKFATWEQGPAIALAGGLLASGVIVAAVHFGLLNFRRERMLRRANAALEQQLVDTRRVEGEVREVAETLAARVSKRTEELDDTIVELETFNYSVSHDLRGPLGAVINFAAILREDYGERLDATGIDYLERIVGSASSAVTMMDALLAYSRSGRTELKKTNLDMKHLVQEVCDELTANLPDLQRAVQVGNLPNVRADENMMRFIFTNLISNAFKFARKGEAPRVEIDGSPGSDEVVFSVRDHGIGFDMRFAEKLFKVFERLHSSGDYEGHGVGLAIVARMVRRHGGRCWAQGALDKGATFSFTVATTGAENDGSVAR
ncbi:MAG: ATP-binding protein, partial [Proteobacteria bacterium]|nr:ATP-binding protein [Pseudomonadota bacterium]